MAKSSDRRSVTWAGLLSLASEFSRRASKRGRVVVVWMAWVVRGQKEEKDCVSEILRLMGHRLGPRWPILAMCELAGFLDLERYTALFLFFFHDNLVFSPGLFIPGLIP